MKGPAFYIAICLLFASGLKAQDRRTTEVEEKKKKVVKEKEVLITVNYDEDPADEEEFDSELGQLFNSPALASGLSNGSALINRSIESVMDLVFYSLLDQELAYDLNDHSQFKIGIDRELFQVPNGGYVVVDRFSVGPEYARQLATLQGVPVSLGIDGRVNVLDIYLTSDGSRLARHAELPAYRRVLNNWLGLLPFLSVIMPPSFNPNEMYDPVNLLGTPFSFPVTIGGLRAMPIGAIRSYNISGGVSLPLEFADRIPKDIMSSLERADGVTLTLPYSIFVEGEYRINVLRRSKNIAWVGLTKVKRLGHRISSSMGRVFKLMDKLINANWWTGVPAALLPLDAEWSKARANIFNQLYEFDLRRKDSRRAYEKAVKGDFSLAMKRHKQRINEGLDTGVRFHFVQDEYAWETGKETSPNLLVLSSRRENIRSESEIEITDEKGKFYLLRGNQEVRDQFLEALTGKQKRTVHSRVEMDVNKIEDPDKPGEFIYEFKSNITDPVELTISMQLQDRYVDAHEYRKYIKQIRYFTQLPLKSAPKIPRRDDQLKVERMRRIALSDPSDDVLRLHVTPTYLGRLSATAAMKFSTTLLDQILSKSEDEKWSAFSKAFGLRQEDWKTSQSREGFWKSFGHWSRYGFGIPFGWFNIRSAEWDFIAEATGAMDALSRIRESSTPMKKLDGFYSLFTTDYPARMTRALMLLTDLNKIPRSVNFNTRAKGKASPEIKKAFNSLNGKTFRSVEKLHTTERSRIPEEKLREFFPDQIKERGSKPVIKKIDISMRPLPREYIEQFQRNKYVLPNDARASIYENHAYVRMQVKNMNPALPGKFYIKVEESGQLQLGKFVLGEQVITANAIRDDSAGVGTLVYEFFVTGPLCPFQGLLYRNAVSVGGEFQMYVSASRTGRIWSDERNFKFGLLNGRLVPP